MRRTTLLIPVLLIGCSLPKGGSVPEMKAELGRIGDCLRAFRDDCGRYPTTEEGLAALTTAPSDLKARWRGPYAQHKPDDDPWGNPYLYVSDGHHYTLTSLGGEGMDADVDEQG